jgi:hypothetical protein
MGLKCYPRFMAKPEKFDLENPAPVADDEDEEILAALTKHYGTPKPVEGCLLEKFGGSSQSGLPSRC